MVGILLKDQDIHKTGFQQLGYHRIFIMLFLELSAQDPVLENIMMSVSKTICIFKNGIDSNFLLKFTGHDCILSHLSHFATSYCARVLLFLARNDFTSRFLATNFGRNTTTEGLVNVFTIADGFVQIPGTILAQRRIGQARQCSVQGHVESFARIVARFPRISVRLSFWIL